VRKNIINYRAKISQLARKATAGYDGFKTEAICI